MYNPEYFSVTRKDRSHVMHSNHDSPKTEEPNAHDWTPISHEGLR